MLVRVDICMRASIDTLSLTMASVGIQSDVSQKLQDGRFYLGDRSMRPDDMSDCIPQWEKLEVRGRYVGRWIRTSEGIGESDMRERPDDDPPHCPCWTDREDIIICDLYVYVSPTPPLLTHVRW